MIRERLFELFMLELERSIDGETMNLLFLGFDRFKN